ncbi:MAG: amylo-alpha-1,6-glucosidase [Acidobacteriia bacterium]|nr:amylo-alpha-1,6-glucosidase [Terriglobia bacterium]
MEDVIQIENRFYVLATSSLADDRTRVLKWGETFAVFNRLGDIESTGLGEQGLYHNGTRYLSRLALRMGDKVPQLLRSTIQDDNSCLTLDMMNPDVYRDANLLLPRGSVHLFRSKFLWRDVCYDRLRLANFSMYPVETSVSVEFLADYADIFQVRGTKRQRAGEMLSPIVEDDCVVLSYRGLDGEVRCTRLQFAPRPTRIAQNSVQFAVSLQPKEETSVSLNISCEERGSGRVTMDYDKAMSGARASAEQDRQQICRITTSNARFNAWLLRSEADVHMMISGNPEGAYPYAGVPWFNTVFGRDGILTAMECLWAAPRIAKSVLRFLAETQATSIVPEQEAEPGKILHEMRHGEMANLKEVPFGRYYGSADATPLFVMLAGAYLDCSADLPFVKEIWPNVLAALDWIDTYGDADKDGFVEYRAKAEKGLVQQGWKDSHDSVFHRDGSLAVPPIALCEVQAYVYGAKKTASQITKHLGFDYLARKFGRDAETLRDQFERQFWDETLGTYVLALDADKKACRVKSSNAGHCLWTGIVSKERASRMARTLLGEDLFCGWGVRTLSSGEVRYNPMSYHNGSVWPHDNAIIASGLSRYGHKREASQILNGLLEASAFMELNRLPELFCGFHKRSDLEGPTLYPVACSPQAWASGSVYLLLESCLGISVQASEHAVEFTSPQLPEAVDWIELRNLRVGSLTVDLRLRRDGDGVSVDVLSTDGGVNVSLRKQ